MVNLKDINKKLEICLEDKFFREIWICSCMCLRFVIFTCVKLIKGI